MVMDRITPERTFAHGAEKQRITYFARARLIRQCLVSRNARLMRSESIRHRPSIIADGVAQILSGSLLSRALFAPPR
jgi:hypothetical protein